MTADRVAMVDWDESHVDVPDLDLALPYNAAGLDDDAYDIAAQARAAWGSRRLLGPQAGPTSSQSIPSDATGLSRCRRPLRTGQPDNYGPVWTAGIVLRIRRPQMATAGQLR